ncbi:hypothetical protein V2J09_020355 [Rumex salicifolius]
MSGEGKLVCVTGASGFTASWLVKLLLLQGYTVNGTVRNLSDPKKVDHLIGLEGAKERLHLFEADLNDEGSFDAPIQGCHGVFHTASPCSLEGFHDIQRELLDPAIKGTMNVLKSCAKFGSSIKRVVLTSSIGAMVFNGMPITPHTLVDETWWSDPEFCRTQKKWYAQSKLLAEKAAWEFARDKGIDLVSIFPGWTLGPLLQPTLNTSCALILDLIGTKTCPEGAYGWVHVKDVADAHIKAFETQSATGRYCVVERDVYFHEIKKILRDSYSTFQLSNEYVEINPYMPPCKYKNKKAESLGIHFIPFEISLKETIESFKEKKFIE